MSRFPASRFLSTSALLMGARVAGAGAGFVAQILLARLMPSEQLGLFFLTTSVAAVLGTAASSGFPSIATRFFARYEGRGRLDLLAAFAAQARRDVAMSGFVAAFALAAFALLAPSLSSDLRFALALGAISVPAIALARLNGAFANAVRRFGLSFMTELLWRPILFVLAVAAWSAFGPAMSGMVATALMSLVVVLLAAWQARQLRSYLPLITSADGMNPRAARLWRRAARPLMVVTLFTALFADLDLVIVGFLLPAAELAVFGVCLKLAFLVGFGVQMVTQMVGRDLADGYTRQDHDLIARAVARTNGLLVLGTLGTLAGTAAFGDELLRLFGEEFAGGHAALLVLVSSQCVRALAGPSIPLLTLSGGQGRSMALTAVSLGVLVVASVLLTPPLGLLGAALAVALTFLFWAVSLAALLHRRTGLRTDVIASLLHWRGARPRSAFGVPPTPTLAVTAVREPQVLR